MMRRATPTSRARQRGQGLAEAGIVIVLMVVLMTAIMDFGRMLLLLNMITNATREAARAAAVVNSSGRCQSNGHLTMASQTNLKSMVTTQLANTGIAAADVQVQFDESTTNGVPVVSVTTAVPIRWSIMGPLMRRSGEQLNTSRTVTFRNEFVSGNVAGC